MNHTLTTTITGRSNTNPLRVLVLMAFVQRIVNGGGHIDREYGVGRGRVDLLVRWPYRAPDGSRAVQRLAVEIKVWRSG